MPAVTPDALIRGLKQRGGGSGRSAGDVLAPAYYLYGDEDVLKEEAVRALLERALEPGARDFNLDQPGISELDPQTLHSLVNTPPMLASRRAVVLRGVEQLRRSTKLRSELVRYLGAPSPTTLLILVQGPGDAPDPELVRLTTAVEIDSPPPDGVARWVSHLAAELELDLEPAASKLLITSVGNDLGALGQELRKLAAAVSGRPATSADVAALVGVRRGATLPDLVKAALERRAIAAAELVEPVLEQAGMTGVKIVTALGTALVGTALARAELDRGTPRARLERTLLGHIRAARPYGLGSWEEEATRWAAWAEGWRRAGLRLALRRTLAADRALKSSTFTDERGVLLELVLSWMMPIREVA